MSNINQLVFEELTTGQKVGLGVGAAAATPYIAKEIKTGMAQNALGRGQFGEAAQHMKSANAWSTFEPHKLISKGLRKVGDMVSSGNDAK